MEQPGIALVEAAKADGRWEKAYAPPREMKVPKDFIAALEDDPVAMAFFNSLNKTHKHLIAFRLNTAVKPETRQRRFVKLLEMIKAGRKPQ